MGKLPEPDCQIQKNIFFLKSSKTGSTTMMSIFQRFGLHYDSRFLMGENHGGMAVNNRPFNLEQDCWIGKTYTDEKIEFDLSTNHLHYNKSAIEYVMKKPFVKIGIAREPESHFISSFNFYHNLMLKFTYRLNPDGQYLKNLRMKQKPTKEDVVKEMDTFLKDPWLRVKKINWIF
jgi:hypothetical protein